MILDEIAASTRRRVKTAKTECPPDIIRGAALEKGPLEGFPFEKALAKEGLRFICEVKRASPSKGLIARDFPYLDIARDYEAAGAAAVSVLTEPEYFLGSGRILAEIAPAVSIPVLRKDFILDEYQIYEARLLGASAVLLICALLPAGTLRSFLTVCDRLGLSALVEAHDAEEMKKAASCGARVVGVNNRNLRDFSVDFENSARLRALAPKDALFVAESGVQTAEDAAALRDAGVDAVLVGEALMRASDRRRKLRELRGAEETATKEVAN